MNKLFLFLTMLIVNQPAYSNSIITETGNSVLNVFKSETELNLIKSIFSVDLQAFKTFPILSTLALVGGAVGTYTLLYHLPLYLPQKDNDIKKLPRYFTIPAAALMGYICMRLSQKQLAKISLWTPVVQALEKTKNGLLEKVNQLLAAGKDQVTTNNLAINSFPPVADDAQLYLHALMIPC